MAGHLFIVRDDVTQIACDGWLMPASLDLEIEDYWLQPESPDFRQSLAELRQNLCDDWVRGDIRVLPAPFWPDGRSKPWMVNLPDHSLSEMHKVVRQFIESIQELAIIPTNNRDRLLLALPVISTGKGGGAKVKGQVIASLVRLLADLVMDYDVDIVLVTHTAAALAAAQKARKVRSSSWPELSEAMIAKARELAEMGRNQGLALFLGAGVSVSAGLPSWNGLLRLLARDINLSDAELVEFDNLDVYDRGSILDRRYRSQGMDLRKTVANIFERTSEHSLLHAYLACLPASEIITQNYDRLFESAALGVGRPVTVLPYTPGLARSRWLLKMHGCVCRPDDIVIQREDYIRYTQRRAALAGIVQATLLTRYLLFVGFSLRDGNFHRAVDDVRRAIRDQKKPKGWGTALFVNPSPLIAELWHSELDIVHFQRLDEGLRSVAPAARRLEIFLDCLLAHCGSNTDHLLDSTFAHLLTKGEQELKEALLALPSSLSDRACRTEAWKKVEELLRSLGWG